MINHFPVVGVIGAGQLARMMIAPATALGIDLRVFAQDSHDSAAQIINHVVGDYKNLTQVLEFAQSCDVVTFEHELIPLSVVKGLESNGIKVYPPSSAFIYSQDKAAMRAKLIDFLAPTSQVITEASAVNQFPAIAKAISGGVTKARTSNSPISIASRCLFPRISTTIDAMERKVTPIRICWSKLNL